MSEFHCEICGSSVYDQVYLANLRPTYTKIISVRVVDLLLDKSLQESVILCDECGRDLVKRINNTFLKFKRKRKWFLPSRLAILLRNWS